MEATSRPGRTWGTRARRTTRHPRRRSSGWPGSTFRYKQIFFFKKHDKCSWLNLSEILTLHSWLSCHAKKPYSLLLSAYSIFSSKHLLSLKLSFQWEENCYLFDPWSFQEIEKELEERDEGGEAEDGVEQRLREDVEADKGKLRRQISDTLDLENVRKKKKNRLVECWPISLAYLFYDACYL